MWCSKIAVTDLYARVGKIICFPINNRLGLQTTCCLCQSGSDRKKNEELPKSLKIKLWSAVVLGALLGVGGR